MNDPDVVYMQCYNINWDEMLNVPWRKAASIPEAIDAVYDEPVPWRRIQDRVDGSVIHDAPGWFKDGESREQDYTRVQKWLVAHRKMAEKQ